MASSLIVLLFSNLVRLSFHSPKFLFSSPWQTARYVLWTFLSLNNDVSNCAVSLFFAMIKTPDVSLSSLCTEKGFESLKILLFANISIKFFCDLVPPCTEMP